MSEKKTDLSHRSTLLYWQYINNVKPQIRSWEKNFYKKACVKDKDFEWTVKNFNPKILISKFIIIFSYKYLSERSFDTALKSIQVHSVHLIRQ